MLIDNLKSEIETIPCVNMQNKTVIGIDSKIELDAGNSIVFKHENNDFLESFFRVLAKKKKPLEGEIIYQGKTLIIDNKNPGFNLNLDLLAAINDFIFYTKSDTKMSKIILGRLEKIGLRSSDFLLPLNQWDGKVRSLVFKIIRLHEEKQNLILLLNKKSSETKFDLLLNALINKKLKKNKVNIICANSDYYFDSITNYHQLREFPNDRITYKNPSDQPEKADYRVDR